MRKTTSMGRYSSKWSVFSEKWKLGNEAIKYLSYQHQRAKWSKKKKGWQGQVGKTIKKAIEIHPLPNAFNKGNVYVKHHMGLMSGHPLCWGQAVSEEGCVRQVPVPLDCSSAGDRHVTMGGSQAGPLTSVPPLLCGANLWLPWLQGKPLIRDNSLCPVSSPAVTQVPVLGFYLFLGDKHGKWNQIYSPQTYCQGPSTSWVLFLPIFSPCSLSRLLLPAKHTLSVSNCARCSI